MSQLKATQELLKTPPLGYRELFPDLLDWNPFLHFLAYRGPAQLDKVPLTKPFYEPVEDAKPL